jgi:hypothetical protein
MESVPYLYNRQSLMESCMPFVILPQDLENNTVRHALLLWLAEEIDRNPWQTVSTPARNACARVWPILYGRTEG